MTPPRETTAAPLVTFIIPIRHPQSARDWGLVRVNLAATAASIGNQTSDDWQAIVVANEEADLAVLPKKFIVERVGFPPNAQHERAARSVEDFHDAFPIDKGRRVLRGMLRARPTHYFVIVDDDDFANANLVSFVAQKGTPLTSLPFRGAVYRVAHAGSQSGAWGLLKKYFFRKSLLKKPLRLFHNLMHFRVLTDGYRREFFGLQD